MLFAFRHIFQMVRGQKIYEFSVNFLSFLGFFEWDVRAENCTLSGAIRFATFSGERGVSKVVRCLSQPHPALFSKAPTHHFRFDPHRRIGYARF